MYFSQKQTDSDVKRIKKNVGVPHWNTLKSLFLYFTADEHN